LILLKAFFFLLTKLPTAEMRNREDRKVLITYEFESFCIPFILNDVHILPRHPPFQNVEE
jgi:hypothetical protein